MTGKVSGIIVLDDDDGGQTMKANGWRVPPTPTVKTRRGHQYYFRCPEGGFPTCDLAPKVEVRADRAYVVAPPSTHPEGDSYEWVISPEEEQLADPPAWLLKQARLRGRRMRAEDVGEAIPNGTRNKTLSSIAGTLRRRGLDEASICAALLGINGAKCKPPLDEDEVRRIAGSVARYDGSFSFSFPNKEKTINDPPPRPKAVRFVDMGAPEPRRYLIGGLLPESYPTVLYGDGGVAKSMLALSASLAVARGSGSWLGRPVTSGPVLYVDFELDAQEQNRRIKRLARAEGLNGPPENMLYMSALGFQARAAFEAALEECKEHEVKLMILDSLGPALQGDAEAARDVIAFYQSVLEPFRAAGVTVVVVDHQSKLQAGERYQSKRAFGSVFKGNLARSVIQVEARDRAENKLSLRLRQVKHNFGPLADPFGVELRFSEEEVSVAALDLEASDLAEEQTLNATDRIRYALKDGPAYPDDIAEATGLASATVKSTLSKLRKGGEVEATGERGKWGVEQVRLSFIPYKGNENENDPGERRVYSPQTPPPTNPNGGNKSGGENGTTPREEVVLAEHQERRRLRLEREGMSEEWALKTVLAGDHPLDCECEVCA